MGLFNFLKKKKIAKKGDFIKCIDDRNWNTSTDSMKLVYNKQYKVLNVVKCPDCGAIAYDIGCRTSNPNQYTQCTSSHVLPMEGVHLAGAFRFVLATDADDQMTKEEFDKEIQEAIEWENYELAQILKTKKEKLYEV